MKEKLQIDIYETLKKKSIKKGNLLSVDKKGRKKQKKIVKF